MASPSVLGHLAAFAATQGDVWPRHLIEFTASLIEEPDLIETCLARESDAAIASRARAYLLQIDNAPPPAGLDERATGIFHRLRRLVEEDAAPERRPGIMLLLAREACYRAADRLRV